MGSINHDIKALFIHVPKCGGIYISSILEKFYGFKPLILSDIYDNSTTNLSVKLSNLLEGENCSIVKNLTYKMTDEHKKIYDSYTKFTFVRNPYTRLLSSISYCTRKLTYITNIEQYFNFIKTMEDSSLLNYNIFHSITSQTEHLQLINEKYDYIGKFEDLDKELINILLKLNLKITHERFLINNIILNEKKKSINKIITNDMLEYINNLFLDDFDRFGYNIITDLNIYNNVIINNDDIKDILKNKRYDLINDIVSNNTIVDPYEKIIIDSETNNYINILKKENIEQPLDRVNIYASHIKNDIMLSLSNNISLSISNMRFNLKKGLLVNT